MKFNALYLLSLITAIIEGLLFSGLIFGWSSINYVLEKEGYFSNYCEQDQAPASFNSSLTTAVPTLSFTTADANFSTTAATASVPLKCKAQEESINLVFTVASGALSFSTLPNGFLFDRFGTWVSRVIAILLFTCGCVLVSISTIATSWILFPAMCCISIGGILLLVTNMQLGNLFGSARSSVITILNGALDSSSFVFLIVKLVYDQGISFSAIFQFIAICTVFQWARTILLMPRMHIPFPLPKGKYKYGMQECCRKQENDLDQSKVGLQESVSAEDATAHNDTKPSVDVKPISEEVTFMSCIKTRPFWTNLFHMSVLQLRNYFFLGTFFKWMTGIIASNQIHSSEIDSYINIFGVCQFFGVVTAPLNGLLIDGSKKFFSKTPEGAATSSPKAIAVSAFTTTTLGVLFSIVISIPVAQLQYISFVLQVVFRSFLYGGNASFIAFTFPVQHFGKLYGATMTLAGIVAILQFPLFSLVLRHLEEDFLAVNIAFIIVCALTYIHPIMMLFSTKNKKKPQNGIVRKIEMENLTTAEM